MQKNMWTMRRALCASALGFAASAVACGGPQIDRTGWECWEEQPCGEGFLCSETHECVPEIQDIPGVVPAALAEFNRGIVAMNASPPNYTGALAAFERAVVLDPDFWEAYENIGLLQMDLGMYREAAATFEAEEAKVRELVDRDWPVEFRMDIFLNIGKSHALAGNQAAAEAAFNEMLTLDERNAEARANLAALYVRFGNFENAQAYIGELLELTQNDVGALNVLALIYKEQGDMQMAEYLWEKAIGEIGAAVDSLDNEEQYEGLTEQQREALARYNASRAERMLKLQADIQNELGIVAYAEGETDLAEQLFRTAIGTNPTNAAARTNLGTVYLEYAFWDAACEQFEESLALRPRDRAGMVGYAACSYGGGDVETGYAAYERAHDAHSGDAFITEQLLNIAFRELNDYDQTEEWCAVNLEQRGQQLSSCDASNDRTCALCRSIDQLRQSQQPADPNSSDD